MGNEIIDGLIKALQLILSGDPTVMEITGRSILVSSSATMLSVLWGLPAATILGLKRFRGRFLLKGFFNAMLGIPTVALGLVLYLFFSKAGPIGFLHLLYSPSAMIIGQAILITPITVSFIASAIESVDPEIKDLAKTLGASETEASIAVLKESMNGVVLAITASFNRAIAELGVVLMVGGNIAGLTSVLTTTIALETTKGNIELSIALAIILLLIVSVLSISINLIQRRKT
ncbi:MAG: ABC transporter permease [Candidatus Bathyarchaeota archaeon]|nr:ABC transporter permease [Candidatus Bathyarchaeota archaeon]MDH5636736.1 ABC transporter permease [Candidatus Bathyarchaeota archaeon]MDH5701989.1 ABC transporter permease [Candidatus Bathyarchaeota archaeon]